MLQNIIADLTYKESHDRMRAKITTTPRINTLFEHFISGGLTDLFSTFVCHIFMLKFHIITPLINTPVENYTTRCYIN